MSSAGESRTAHNTNNDVEKKQADCPFEERRRTLCISSSEKG